MTKEKLEAMRLPELRALFTKLSGEPTMCPNKVFLVRRILEMQTEQRKAKRAETKAAKARAAPASPPAAQASAPGTPAVASPPAAQPVPPAAQPVPPAAQPVPPADITSLQAQYLAAVGRPTGSTNVAYIKWKIGMARKGLVPVGPKRGGAGPHVVLALRLPVAAVAALDGAWPGAGHKSRVSALRAALKAFLAQHGRREAAELLAE